MAIFAADTTTRARRNRLFNNCRDGKAGLIGFSDRWVIERWWVVIGDSGALRQFDFNNA